MPAWARADVRNQARLTGKPGLCSGNDPKKKQFETNPFCGEGRDDRFNKVIIEQMVELSIGNPGFQTIVRTSSQRLLAHIVTGMRIYRSNITKAFRTLMNADCFVRLSHAKKQAWNNPPRSDIKSWYFRRIFRDCPNSCPNLRATSSLDKSLDIFSHVNNKTDSGSDKDISK